MGAWEVSWEVFGGSFGALAGLFGTSGRLLGASWEPLGASWRSPGTFWGTSGSHLGDLGGCWTHLGASWSALGASWEGLGRILGASWERLGSILEVIWCVWELFWRYFGAWEAYLMRFVEILKNHEKPCKVLQKPRFGGLEICEKLSLEGKLGQHLTLRCLVRVQVGAKMGKLALLGGLRRTKLALKWGLGAPKEPQRSTER